MSGKIGPSRPRGTARSPTVALAPGIPYEIYDRPTAESKVAAATEVFEWLRKLIRV